ncbi:hypothetical protein MPSEU_000624000 [Mayamaea pseudoterrestris]|nr:hypothetical protein MPSEU_000624000 [Mayamaea pseudoterrestris]
MRQVDENHSQRFLITIRQKAKLSVTEKIGTSDYSPRFDRRADPHNSTRSTMATTSSSSTSPRELHAAEYIAAREQQTEEYVFIQERPYLPRLAVINTDDHDNIRAVVAKVLFYCKKHVSFSTAESTASWKVTPIMGGITNQLFRVDISAKSSILVRIFGAVGLIDRDLETASLAILSDMNMAPPYVGRFANGRLEGWMNDMRPLTVNELNEPTLAHGIAKQLAKLHTECFITTASSNGNHQPMIWAQLGDWGAQAIAASFQNDIDTSRARELQLEQYANKICWLKETMQSLAEPPTIAFCHNDLLGANVLLNDATRKIQLIDFEYGNFNYAMFDLANHWNEYAGGTEPGTVPNYDWLPTPTAQRGFLKAYLEQVDASRQTMMTKTVDQISVTKLDTNNESNVVNSDGNARIDALLEQIYFFQMVNHLYWGLWAVNQASMDGCEDFDYLIFASKRLGRFQHDKQEWMNKLMRNARGSS